MLASYFDNEYVKHIHKILAYFVYWWIFYLLIHFTITIKLKREEVLDLKNRLVSMIHGILSTCFCIGFIFWFGYDMKMKPNTFFEKIDYFSLSYFLYDLSACYIFGLFDLKLLFHHCLCISGFSIILFTGRGIFVGIIGLILAEASNFPMHLRGIVKNLGLRHTLLYEVSDAFYMVIYILLRGFIAPFVCAQSYFEPNISKLIPLIFALILLQSFKFIGIMLKILKKRYDDYIERKNKNISLFWFSVNPKISNLDYFSKKDRSVIF